MSLDWQHLRPWDGSQQLAFETLCCQLAAYEQTPRGSTFTRKGAPDAGLECYWTLPGGDEWGWQAKYFLSSPGTSQWQQLDGSVMTALEKHPRLTSLTICLPIDRQDPRIEEQEWFMDKWNSHVEKWEEWALQREMSVQFEYWGDHEIAERLSREDHRGRHFFWFSSDLLSQHWFENRLEEAVANVGPRYTPDLNIELPIARSFDGLGRTSAFCDRIRALCGQVRRAYKNAQLRTADDFAQSQYNALDQSLREIWRILEALDCRSVEVHIDFDMVADSASESGERAWQCARLLEEEADRRKQLGEQQVDTRPEDFGFERHYLYELISKLSSLEELASSNEARLANLPALLLVGDAGTGKTHLFCDIASRRAQAGLPTILLLGGQFSSQEPWSQIVRLLGLSCTKEEFLGALEAAGQAAGARALILIDALNEGDGKDLWYKHLAGMLTTLSRYPWVGVAFSVRTSYENTVIPPQLTPQRLVRCMHLGFAEHEYQATRTFFDYYGLVHPTVPLLVPEFQNPLFLRLLCEGLSNQGLTMFPEGCKGITAIFEMFVDSVNDKLHRPEYLDFDRRSYPVQDAVARVAEMMADRGSRWLPREEAREAVDAFLPRDGYQESLFRHLVAEGLIAEDRFWLGDDEWNEGVHFSYERLADHFIVRHLLDSHLDAQEPSRSFSRENPLGSLVKDEQACWGNKGLIEALSVQLPERIGRELTEVAPATADYQPVREAFVDSLVWRDHEAITDATLEYINDHVARHESTYNRFLDVLLTLASRPEHPYNADFLHSHLRGFGLAERDAWWSVFLHYEHGEHGAVDRLVDWAWSSQDKSHIDDEAIRLCGVALAWFLTTPNRFLRDRATKALVSLFTERIHVLRALMNEFLQVNDPYVLERLFAVACGSAMRSTESSEIGVLARDIYEWVFEEGEPPPHILLRDYARGVIELAYSIGADLDVDIEKVRPPYESEWPAEIPAEEELEKYGEWRDGMPDEEWARVALYSSVMGFGDFARYIIGTNSDHFEWSSCPLGEPREPSRKETFDSFVQSLTDRQREAFDRYQNLRSGVRVYRGLNERQRAERYEHQFSDEELHAAVDTAERSLRRTLGQRKLNMLEEEIIPYLNDPNRHRDEYHFDLSVAQRWILGRVMDLGWTVERFGYFDRQINRYLNRGRSAHKAERMGKKYQWIAYHEFLARVSDNFEFKGDSWAGQADREYDGPWQLGVRDIDPSCLLRTTGREEGWDPQTTTWWFPAEYNAWELAADDVDWLMSTEDLPSVDSLIDVADPSDGSRWLVMETFCSWGQPNPPEEERYELPRRDIWCRIRTYFVKDSDIEEMFEWASDQDFMGGWMPESDQLSDVFLGEFFWSPAFSYHNVPYYYHEGWTRGWDGRVAREILVATDQYVQAGTGYDCSVDDTIAIYLPAKSLADDLDLRWNGVDGNFFDTSSRLVAFDPSIRTLGPSALLVDREALLSFLEANDLNIFWTITGEKRIIGGRMGPDDWKGRLKVSGAYRIRDDRPETVLNAEFVSPGSSRFRDAAASRSTPADEGAVTS